MNYLTTQGEPHYVVDYRRGSNRGPHRPWAVMRMLGGKPLLIDRFASRGEAYEFIAGQIAKRSKQG